MCIASALHFLISTLHLRYMCTTLSLCSQCSWIFISFALFTCSTPFAFAIAFKFTLRFRLQRTLHLHLLVILNVHFVYMHAAFAFRIHLHLDSSCMTCTRYLQNNFSCITCAVIYLYIYDCAACIVCNFDWIGSNCRMCVALPLCVALHGAHTRT